MTWKNKLLADLLDELGCARSDLTSEMMKDPDLTLKHYKKAVKKYFKDGGLVV